MITESDLTHRIAIAVASVVSPKFLYTLVAMVFSLVLGLLYLWNVAETNRSWLISHQGSIKAIEARLDMEDKLDSLRSELEAQNEILRSISESISER